MERSFALVKGPPVEEAARLIPLGCNTIDVMVGMREHESLGLFGDILDLMQERCCFRQKKPFYEYPMIMMML
jgi:hypothetical protein